MQINKNNCNDLQSIYMRCQSKQRGLEKSVEAGKWESLGAKPHENFDDTPSTVAQTTGGGVLP